MLLSLSGIHKLFGGVAALRGADLNVKEADGHLLLGENGAGKSTLMRIVAGMLQPDSGGVLWRGRPVRFRSPLEASREGIAMVHQESLLAPHLSVAENIYLARGSGGIFVRRRVMAENARQLISDHGFKINPASLVSELTPAGKQLVELCRAVAHGSSLIVFDEPTSALSTNESQEVFRIVTSLRARGIAIIYITHRLDELKSIGDSLTILRDGATVYSGPLHNLTREDLIQHMVGRRVDQLYQRRAGIAGEVLLRVEGVCRGILRDVSLEVRAGEIVGLAGLMGAGRTELCRVLFGIDAAESGTVEVAGHRITGKDPRQAIRTGIALIPEDRQRHGLVLKLPVASNITLAALQRVSSYGFLRKNRELESARKYRDSLRIKCDSVRAPARTLSGGNQQKVAIAKWVARGARVFLFDEPTRGIDVAAKQEVFEQMDRLAREGAAVLMVSSELAELTQVADRILVLCGGRLTGELAGDASQQQIMNLAAPTSDAQRAIPS